MIPKSSKLLYMLSNNDVTFFIPPYQRNYEWDSEQCEVFFNDVLKTTRRNLDGEETEHFFGSVTYFQDTTAFGEPDKLVLIDGQQRITTTMLFLVALRDLVDSETTKKFIDNKYLKNENTSDDTEYKIKLKQVETDWNAYSKVILGLDLDETEKNSAINQNYLYFKRLLNNISDEYNLVDLIEKGLNSFSIIGIELQPKQNKWENPQEIFESMNSLGKPLSLADLVRNYLLLGLAADEQEKLYKTYWLEIEHRLTNISNYIRDYMQLKATRAFNKASEKNYKTLYADFKDIFKNIDSTILLKDLYIYSKYYSYIVRGVSSGCVEIDRRLGDVRYIGISTSYSLIMGFLESWDNGRITKNEMLEILDTILVYFIRRRIAGLGGAENKGIPELTRRIEDIEKADDKKDKLLQILSNQESNLRLPNDIEMERELSLMNFYNFKYSKFILSLVEEKITKCRPSLDDVNLQLEHIMPQKLNQTWEESLGDGYEEIHQEYINSIGNLTLIRHNQELGNKSFDEKKEIYINNSGLQIAKNMIVENEVWNKESIINRAEWIISFILQKVLAIPESMRRVNNFSSSKSHSLSFLELQLIGEEITYCKDKSIKAKVVTDVEVEFEGRRWRLSPLTREIETRRGTVTKSGSYQGSQYWEYEGMRLADFV